MSSSESIVEMIPLGLIDPNPYQTRERENPEHIQKLAASIAASRLLQIPAARRVGDRVQLAFGHSRFAAYRLLNLIQTALEYHQPMPFEFEDDSPLGQAVVQADARLEEGVRFDQMPLTVRELSDQAMFEEAVRENHDRADLTAIEEARAMLRYRDEFGKTSAQIGALFGLSESAVRNKMRLVELPESTQKLVEDGSLGEITARKILSVEKVLPGAGQEIAKQLAANGIHSPEQVNSKIEYAIRDKGKQMYSARYSKDGAVPTGGAGLWPLDWQVKFDPRKVKFDVFRSVYEGPDTFTWSPTTFGQVHRSDWTLKQVFDKAITQWQPYSPTAADIHQEMRKHLTEMGADAVLKALDQLITPPACTACPFYLRLDGVHWCMLMPCWKNKKAAWLVEETERISKELNIPVYDKERDGAYEEFFSQWNDRDSAAKNWFEKRADHLRIKTNYQEYSTHYLTDSAVAGIVSVRKEYQEKVLAQKEDERAKEAASDHKEQNMAASLAFIHERVIPAMADQLLGNIRDARAVALFGDSWSYSKLDLSQPRKPEIVDKAKHILLERSIKSGLSYDVLYTGPVMVAKKLQEKLPTWDVKISGDLIQIARTYEVGYVAEPDPVSVETQSKDEVACPNCGTAMEEEKQDDGWIWLHCKKCDTYQSIEQVTK